MDIENKLIWDGLSMTDKKTCPNCSSECPHCTLWHHLGKSHLSTFVNVKDLIAKVEADYENALDQSKTYTGVVTELCHSACNSNMSIILDNNKTEPK